MWKIQGDHHAKGIGQYFLFNIIFQLLKPLNLEVMVDFRW